MKRCAACKAGCRKTTTVWLPGPKGLRRGRVCSGCVSSKTVTVLVGGAVTACRCGAAAAMCHGCAIGGVRRDEAELLKLGATRLRNLAKAYPGTERAEGLEQGADILAGLAQGVT